jgi:hypothetical protein
MKIKKRSHLGADIQLNLIRRNDGGLQAIDLEASEGSAGARTFRAQLPRLPVLVTPGFEPGLTRTGK